MMKKSNKILIGCLALLLVMSIGYALFSDTITINGTATAKGEFELTTTCDMDVSAVGVDPEIGSVSDAVITCEDNVVNASATLGYPRSEKWFRVMVTNTGTIPAKLKEVVELNNPEIYFCNADECFGLIENYTTYKTDAGKSTVWAELYDGYDGNDYQDGEVGLNHLYDIEQFNAVLDPGETAFFYVKMYWEYSSNIQSSEPLIANLNAEITWEQVTTE